MSKRICSIEGCERPMNARGWCKLHYRRWQRHGDPTVTLIAATTDEAFLARVKPDGDCLVWTGPLTDRGYGRLDVSSRGTAAHRYAWEREYGPIPPGKEIDHICWNRACCRIEHLRLASPAENRRYQQGARAGSATGVRNVYRRGSGFSVQVQSNGVARKYGTFPTIEEAAAVAERVRSDLFGRFAGLG